MAIPAHRTLTGAPFTVVRTVIPDSHKTRWNRLPMLITERPRDPRPVSQVWVPWNGKWFRGER